MNYVYKFLVLLIIATACSRSESVTFAVCADVHQDIIHDGPQRLRTFVENAEKEHVDFIVQLGDFCYPKEENQDFLKIWKSFSGPRYHVLGNHDMDKSTKQEEMAFWNMKKAYYSFDIKAFHFIVLDPNFFVDSGQYFDYDKANYFSHRDTRATIPPAQVEWLKKDIANTDNYVVIFSHQSLDSDRGVSNQKEIRKILEDANRSGRKVLACFSGHNHLDQYTVVNEIHYFKINSMSDHYIGKQYQCKDRFSDEINLYRPSLKNTLPYDKPVYAVVEINPRGYLNINGVEGAFILPGPKELGVVSDYELSPSVSSRYIKF